MKRESLFFLLQFKDMLKTIKKINNVIRKMCVCLLPVICFLVQLS